MSYPEEYLDQLRRRESFIKLVYLLLGIKVISKDHINKLWFIYNKVQ
jgi:hypothetical protein